MLVKSHCYTLDTDGIIHAVSTQFIIGLYAFTLKTSHRKDKTTLNKKEKKNLRTIYAHNCTYL